MAAQRSRHPQQQLYNQHQQNDELNELLLVDDEPMNRETPELPRKHLLEVNMSENKADQNVLALPRVRLLNESLLKF